MSHELEAQNLEFTLIKLIIFRNQNSKYNWQQIEGKIDEKIGFQQLWQALLY
jgi:hypothetical protein